MNVSLREKPISDGRKSLYLDFYPAILHPDTGKLTRREFLGLYIYAKPRLELERQHNKETRLLGENIRAQRQLEAQRGYYGFLSKKAENKDFLAYFHELAKKQKSEGIFKGSRNSWMSVYRHLHLFTDGQLMSNDVTEEFCRNFREYLTSATSLTLPKYGRESSRSPESRKLNHNSAVAYYTVFKASLKRAVDDKILAADPSQKVKRLTRKETQREFLNLAELQALARTECDLPDLKRAALFSALTGLRYSDIAKLVWSEVYSDETGHYLRFTQKKTEGVETMPLSDSAYQLLGQPGTATEKVFPRLAYSPWQNQKLQLWVFAAGIHRPITFHAFRHTFATLQLQQGTDIYTISKLLGHRDIATTQIYAKIIDQQKRDAVNRLKIDL
ncbi:site-specific integrase [Nibrella saemangeumensis]|uniref:Site-specific integrase n=1 Tax=Nibrella saemangeumensis TaxID=1084526 RepID=A0ABP8NSQ7_9BACT